MKMITVIGGEFAGLWTLSSTDINKGFLFVKSIPFTEIADVSKRETAKREIFANITLLNGTTLIAKMHEDVYSKLYTRHLENRAKGRKLQLPETRISLRDIPVSLTGLLIFGALFQGYLSPNSTSTTANQSVAEAAPGHTKETLPAIPVQYQKTYRYISMPVSRASEQFGVKVNEGGNLVVETPNHHILFEANNGLISYVDVEFKGFEPCSQTAGFDSAPLLLALGIDPSSLELAKKQAHFHRYYDHVNRLKIGVSCLYDGANLSVGFSSKYYLQ
jgi:hypothetical protein